jgi:hypothetical protein
MPAWSIASTKTSVVAALDRRGLRNYTLILFHSDKPIIASQSGEGPALIGGVGPSIIDERVRRQ